jgi:hypothetical protein
MNNYYFGTIKPINTSNLHIYIFNLACVSYDSLEYKIFIEKLSDLFVEAYNKK